MFYIGSIIKDPNGKEWIVTGTWLYEDYICLSLTTTTGQLGGVRFQQGDEVFIKR